LRIDQITSVDAAVLCFPGGPWWARTAQKTLARILNWATEEGVLRAAPRIKRSKAYGRNARIEPWMEQALLSKMEQDVADVFVIMLDCGMRPAEVMHPEIHGPAEIINKRNRKTALHIVKSA
jgi:hypothetical protein